MKKNLLLMVICMLGYASCFAAGKYWVGAANGNWSDGDNWSLTSKGVGGAGAPGAADSVILNNFAEINMDVSATISAMVIARSTDLNSSTSRVLNTATGSVLTILNNFHIEFAIGVTISTSADVPFNLVFNGATQATGLIQGSLILEGKVPVSGGGGATITAEPGSVVTVRSYGFIFQRNNTAYITSDPSSLRFSIQSYFYIDTDSEAVIPNATFEQDYVTYAPGIYPPPETMRIPGSTVSVSSKIGKFRFLSKHPSFRNLYVNFNDLIADASLGLDSAYITLLSLGGNTGSHTFTLLAPAGSSSTVSANIDNLIINEGNIAMATGTSGAPGTSYRLNVRFFTQSGGNFSLQDFNGARGSSVLAIRRDLVQTGGTFITNSTATDTAAHFVVEMNGPEIIPINRNLPGLSTGQFIRMSSGRLNNAQNKVTLRINNVLGSYNGCCGTFIDLGVTLKSNLAVGNLELLSGTLNTSDTSMVTVLNPDAASGITVSKQGLGYVAGPIRRVTNSTSPYIFPFGKKIFILYVGYAYVLRNATVIPVASDSSIYQAEFFNSRFSDTGVTAPLKGISTNEYWSIAKVAGADASILLALNGAVPGAAETDAIVTARYVNNKWVSERGSAVTPGNAASGSAVSRPLSAFGFFTLGYEAAMQDTVITDACPPDTTFVAGVNCKAKVTWRAPNAMFPAKVGIRSGLHLTTAQLNLKGIYNGHGYYESNDEYHWPDAKEAVTEAGGHLITITTAAENNFVNNMLNEHLNYAWIGLYDTGTPGNFAWVTGEAVDFTNWIPGEPNNLYGMNNPDPTIYEPYVHINGFDSLNRWNDIGAGTTARFLAEFDNPVITYRQLSGPANGDSLSAGTYTVCYEKTNTASGIKDTCCFTITVTCNAITANSHAAQSMPLAERQQRLFSATAFSNPSSTDFTLKVNGYDMTQKISLIVTDISGRVIEKRNSLIPGSIIRFGSGFVPGIYFTRVSQGSKAVIVKLVKE